ncbi:hypothetical protein ACQ5SO_05245 [Rhodovulum sp. DZ06]|uniref:hypothetical protein n=1 Tax=Rhodovulum sp. DZ06 TaxID=3425126 RepID=UPI003D3332C4
MSDAAADPARARRPLMIPRALRAWGDLGGSVREELDANPSEPQVFAWLMIALAVHGVVAVPGEMLLPGMGGEAMPGIAFATSVTLAPLLWYGISALVGAAIRAMGGKLSYGGHRVVWFWFALVMLPVMLVQEMLALPAALAGLTVLGDVLDILAAAAGLWVLVSFYRAAEDWGAMRADRKRFVLGLVYTALVALVVVGVFAMIPMLLSAA